MEGVSPDVARIISHATQDRLRDLVSKLSVIAEHRMEIYKLDTRYEVSTEVRGKLKFLEELDKVEKKRHEEQEREVLLRAIKVRTRMPACIVNYLSCLPLDCPNRSFCLVSSIEIHYHVILSS